MTRILSFGLAAVDTPLLSQPVYARKDGGGGGHAFHGGPKTAHFSAPKQASLAKAMRTPSMPKIAEGTREQLNEPKVIGQVRPMPQRSRLSGFKSPLNKTNRNAV